MYYQVNIQPHAYACAAEKDPTIIPYLRVFSSKTQTTIGGN
jgi:hypothetical protein